MNQGEDTFSPGPSRLLYLTIPTTNLYSPYMVTTKKAIFIPSRCIVSMKHSNALIQRLYAFIERAP